MERTARRRALVDDVFRKGCDEFREFVNPLIAQRARLAGRAAAHDRAPRGGALVDADGPRDRGLPRHAGFGHRNPAVAAARARLPRDATRPTGTRRASTRSPGGWRGGCASARATRTPTSAARAATPSRRP